jgi:hypothetical protein
LPYDELCRCQVISGADGVLLGRGPAGDGKGVALRTDPDEPA